MKLSTPLSAYRLQFPRLIVLVGWMVLGLAPEKAASLPVDFKLALTVDTVLCAPGIPCPGSSLGTFHPLPTIGHTYDSSFAVQDGLLSQTGHNLSGTLAGFRLQIENLVWDAFKNPGANNEFFGFRGPIPGNPGCPEGTNLVCLNAPSPGFDVAGPTITALWGGVFGGADIPYVDFESVAGPGRFNAVDNSRVFVSGTLAISRVPEPASFFLLGSGLVALAGMAFRMKSRGFGA